MAVANTATMTSSTWSYFVDKVIGFGMDSLRLDLIESARKMTHICKENHSYKFMSDKELLWNAGLILTDEFSQHEGITLAAILLFDKDSTIMSVVPRHKTDAIFCIANTDCYDDRNVVITNLIESYERLMAFGQKHLNDTFHLDGIQNVSARDYILREIISNLLMHRDFSNGYVAKIVIEKDKIHTENANISHGHGMLNLVTFDPFLKNPPISKVFREIGLADELGSEIRNTYKKYTKIYSGTETEFMEGDVFRITIPLKDVATATMEPITKDTTKERQTQKILEYCTEPRSAKEILAYIGLINKQHLHKTYIKPLLASGKLRMTIPDKPNSRNQKYIKA